MRNVFLRVFLTLGFLFSTVAAQSEPARITGGGFFITGNQDSQNARIETANLTAIGSLGGFYSRWYNTCLDPECRMGTTVNFSAYNISVGGCVGSCYQFTGGTITLNGVTYQNVYYRGYFNFSPVSFEIPKIARKKGSLRFQKPFSFDGRLQICQVSDLNQNCPADKILYSGEIKGAGTVTMTGNIKIFDNGTTRIPYLLKQSFDYRFEP